MSSLGSTLKITSLRGGASLSLNKSTFNVTNKCFSCAPGGMMPLGAAIMTDDSELMWKWEL